MTDETATATLVEAAGNGDHDAFERLYNRHVGMVHGILLASAPRHLVDDLTQDVFLEAMRHLHHLRDPAAFGAWLARIARNRAIDALRRCVPTVELADEIRDDRSSQAESSEALAILTTIQALPVAYREPLVLRLVEGMTGPEIAQRTGLTPGSVRVNLHRGMKLLRERLGGRHGR
jgi:RNA polymerase sigma-70 factor, ECF subfamily